MVGSKDSMLESHYGGITFKKGQIRKNSTVFSCLRSVAIGKPERQVCKASHCGGKQQ